MPEKEFSAREKRKFLRIPAYANIQFRRVGYILSHHKLSKDVSIKGIRFLSDQFLPVGGHIKVGLQLEEGEMPVEFICKVVWNHSLYDDEFYEIGAEICDISKESHDKLNTYIATNVDREKKEEGQ